MNGLRPYQQRALEQIGAVYQAGQIRRLLLVLATGGGKTRIAAELIRLVVEAGNRVLFLAPRRELVTQASRTLMKLGVGHGVILAGADAQGGLYESVQVASIDTLLSRVRQNKLSILEPHLIIVDEAHLAITKVRKALLDRWPNAVIIGLTATPTRRDGRALGLLFDRLIEPVTVAELQRDGYLVNARYFSVSEPDLARVRTVAGDYHQGELEDAVNQPKLVGDVVAHWLKHAATRRTVVFATSIKHSVALCEEFLRHGVAAEHVDADTPQELRDGTFERFRSGQTQVLTNCFLASYGFDLPELSCVVLARPTKSLMLFLQMVGRGLRTAEGKTDCLVLDHSGCVHRHGFAHDERRWTLDGDRALIQTERTGQQKREEKKNLTCPQCQCVFAGARLCPECNYFFAPVGKEVTTLDGQLVEIGTTLDRESQDKLAFFAELRAIAEEKGWKAGWAAHKFREKFGDWPPRQFEHTPLIQPTLETRRWVRSKQIAWAKSRERNTA